MKTVFYEAAGGVVIHNDQMLLLDRPSRQEIRLPKGHVDPGESHPETAVRETTEETGYAELEIVADLGEQEVEFDYKDRHVRRTEHYYLLRLTGEGQIERPPHDAVDFLPRWVPLAEAPDLLTFAAEQAVARQAIDAYHAQQSDESST